MTGATEYLYRNSAYVSAFSQKLNAYRSTGSFCDVVLVAEGVDFPAHRCVLAAGSDYFHVMFNINMAEKSLSRIHLSGVTADALNSMLDYIYTGTLCITRDSVVGLLIVSSLFMLTDVVESCWKHFLNTLDIQNCIERKMIADAVSSEETSHCIKAFILENFTKLDTDCVVNCPANIIGEVLASEDLSVENELEALKVFLKWVADDLLAKQKFAETILGFVRFGYIFLSRESLEDLLESYAIANESKIYNAILEKAAMSAGKHEARLSYRQERVVVVVGGHGPSSLLDRVEAYQLSSDKWCALSGMNFSRRSFGLVAINRDLFAVGGTMEKVRDRPMPFIERYNVRRDTWEEVYMTSANADLERDHAGIVGFRGNIVLTGGFHVMTGVLSSVTELNPLSGDCRRLASLNKAREGHAAVASGKSIYVIGGKNQLEALDSVERYDVESGTWCSLVSMTTKRYDACAVWFDDKLFVFGGNDGHTVLKSGEVYHPEHGRWEPLPDMLIPRMKFGISVSDECAYVIGGMKGSRGPMIPDVEKYSFRDCSWSSVTPMAEGKMEMSCATIDVPFKFLKQRRT